MSSDLVDQVVKQCHDRGHVVTPQLAAFVLRSLEGIDDLFETPSPSSSTQHLQPSSTTTATTQGSALRRPVRTARSLGRLVAAAVERASAADSPALDLLKMQVAFSESVSTADAVRAQDRAATKAERQRYLSAVVGCRSLTDSALDGLFANAVSYATTKAALGDAGPTDRRTRREVSAIAERVLPRRALADLAIATPEVKSTTLKELAEIIAGIRILQAEHAMSTTTLSATDETPPAIALPRADRLVGDCMDLEQRLSSAASKLQTAVDQYTAVLRHAHNNPGVPKAQPKAGVVRLTEELAHRWQALLFVRGITADIADMRPRLTELATLYRQHLSDLGTAAATKFSPELYPGYRMLARIRRQLFDERALLDDRTNALAAIDQHMLLPPAPSAKRGASPLSPASGRRPVSQPIELSLRPVEVDAANEALAALQEQPQHGPPPGWTPAAGSEVVVLSPADFARWQSGETIAERTLVSLPTFSESAIALRGFCPQTLVSRQGMLVEGARSVGAVVHCDRIYRFATWSALQAFADTPRLWLDELRTLVAVRPELVLLLDLASDPSNAAAVAAAAADTRSPSVTVASGGGGGGGVRGKVDASLQTDVHVEQSRIDREYSANEWDLRRRAVQLADLRRKRTASTQTDRSWFKRETTTQVFLPKNVGTQTGIDASTATPTHHCYLAGLRGSDQREPRAITVEWDLTEAHRTDFVQHDQK